MEWDVHPIHPYPVSDCYPVGFLMVFMYNVLASHQGLSLSPCPWMVEKDRQALSHSFLLFSAIVGYGIVVFCYLSSEP